MAQFLLLFSIEILLFSLLILFTLQYLFINNRIQNDNFPREHLSFFLFLSFIFIIYFYIQETSSFFYSSSLISLDTNTFIIKLFLLLQLIILLILWPTNKLLSNIKITLKLIILILCIISGLCLAINARDLILLYLGIELASLPIYVLVSNKEYMISIEAGIKYYIFGVISSSFFLLGISLIYGLTGSTLYQVIYIYELYVEYIDNNFLYLTFILIIIIFLFKIGIYPFNFWVTNFNEGASLNIVFFLAIIPKLPFIYILILLLFYIFNISFYLKLYIIGILAALSFLTILISIIEGLSDTHIGRIIGQSSMINMSIIFLIVVSLSLIQESFLLLLFLFYLIPTLCLFTLLSLREISANKRDLTVLNDLFTINNYMIILLYFTIISLSGLPFLAGFLGKWYIFELLIDSNYIFIVILLVIASIFSNLFYIRVFFFISSRYRFNNVKIKKSKFSKYFLLTILCFINFALIILQEPLIGGLFCLYS